MTDGPRVRIAAGIERLRRRSRETRRTSEMLAALVDAEAPARLTVGEILDQLGERAFGAFLIVFALPNLVPVPIPGLSALLGIPLILISGQLCLRWPRPWLPRWLADRSFAKEDLDRAFTRGLPYLARLERLCRPRWQFMSVPTTERVIGLVCLALSAILFLPIPFANLLPAAAICLFGLAIAERDGLVGGLGLLLGLTSGVIALGVVLAFVEAAYFLLSRALA